MAFWDGLLGGGGGDEVGLYDELLTDKQRAALRSASSPFSADNLARMSVALAKMAEPSLTPKGGGIASAIAAAAGATAGGRDEQVQNLLKAGLTAQQVQEIKRRLALQEKIVNSPIYQRVLGGGGAATPPGMPSGVPGMPSPANPMVRPGPAVAPPPIPNPPVPPGAVPPGSENFLAPSFSSYPKTAGLLGGDTQMAGLPPQDELIPSGEPGILAALQAAYGGGGAPGLPFPAGAGSDAAPTPRLASADPWLVQNALRSRDNPQGGPLSWQNEWPTAGSGEPSDLGATRGGMPANLPPPVMGGTAARPAGSATPVAGLTGSAWEIANNNLAGLRKPGVYATPSQGGFQTFDTPEQGLAAISRQLDRYASGATTGKPLTTIREIVSTWAPPHENPTEKLIERASRIVGADPNASLDTSDPQVKAKLIESMIAIEQGGRVPISRDLINSVASQPPGDEVIYSGRGVPASSLRQAQYGGGGAATGASQPSVPGDIDAPIPGLGASPRELMALDALSEMAKMGNPFKGFLESYYKTPGYLEEAAGAQARGRTAVEEPMQRRMKYLDMMIQMRQNGVIYDPQTNTVTTDPTYDAMMNRREEDKEAIKQRFQKELKTFEEGITIEREKRGVVTAPVWQPDGTLGEETMTGAERDRRLKDQSMRPGQLRPGDIISKPETKPEPGYALRRGPGGEVTTVPIPGSEAAEKAAAAVRGKEIGDRQLQISRDVVVRSVDRIGENMSKAILPTTGFFGPLVSQFGGTAAGNIASDLGTIKARSSLDAINALRQQGGTLGAITRDEHKLLSDAIVALEQSQTEDQFRENLQIVKQHYIDAVHGPGAYNKYLSSQPVMQRPGVAAPAGGGPVKPADEAAYRALPSGTRYLAPDGTTRTKP